MPFCPDQCASSVGRRSELSNPGSARVKDPGNVFYNETVHTAANTGPRMFFAFRGTAIRVFSTVNAGNCVAVRYTLNADSTVAQQCDPSKPTAYGVQVFQAAGLDPAASHTLVAQSAPLATVPLRV